MLSNGLQTTATANSALYLFGIACELHMIFTFLNIGKNQTLGTGSWSELDLSANKVFWDNSMANLGGNPPSLIS